MFTLPNLSYDYKDLDASIDAATMEIHHTKHHQTYINNLNNAIADTELSVKPLSYLIEKSGSLSPAIRNNAGGHWNHSFFWSIMTPTKTTPSEKLQQAINNSFGNCEKMKEEFANAGLTRFGSGWAWLITNDKKELVITSTPNQDNPLMDCTETNGNPILGLDVWEHAYYLRYQNRRPDYIKAWWEVVNWDAVSDLYEKNISNK